MKSLCCWRGLQSWAVSNHHFSLLEFKILCCIGHQSGYQSKLGFVDTESRWREEVGGWRDTKYKHLDFQIKKCKKQIFLKLILTNTICVHLQSAINTWHWIPASHQPPVSWTTSHWEWGKSQLLWQVLWKKKNKIFLITLETWASTLEISKYNWIYIVVGMLFLTNQTFNQIWTIKINSSSNPHSHFDWTRGWLKLLLRIRRLSSSMKEKYKLRGQIWAVTKVSLSLQLVVSDLSGLHWSILIPSHSTHCRACILVFQHYYTSLIFHCYVVWI